MCFHDECKPIIIQCGRQQGRWHQTTMSSHDGCRPIIIQCGGHGARWHHQTSLSCHDGSYGHRSNITQNRSVNTAFSKNGRRRANTSLFEEHFFISNSSLSSLWLHHGHCLGLSWWVRIKIRQKGKEKRSEKMRENIGNREEISHLATWVF